MWIFSADAERTVQARDTDDARNLRNGGYEVTQPLVEAAFELIHDMQNGDRETQPSPRSRGVNPPSAEPRAGRQTHPFWPCTGPI